MSNLQSGIYFATMFMSFFSYDLLFFLSRNLIVYIYSLKPDHIHHDDASRRLVILYLP